MGRSGTKSAKVYLVSPETAAAAAIAGRITDPRELGLKYPDIELPEQFYIDDSMILQPARASATGVEVEVEVYRGPNIGSPPSFSPLPDTISGLVTIKVGDNITTDHIIPAGSRMKYRSNIAKYAEFVFEPLDRQFYKRASETMRKGKHNIIVAGDSYGQGSSREHAALCPAFLGVKAVIAKSFERIHMANLINFGILPLIFDTKSDYNLIDRGDELEIPNIRRRLSNNEQIAVRDKSKGGHEFKVCTQLTKRERSIILAGGLLPYIKEGIKGGGERG